jgi:hypothetical protein
MIDLEPRAYRRAAGTPGGHRIWDCGAERSQTLQMAKVEASIHCGSRGSRRID